MEFVRTAAAKSLALICKDHFFYQFFHQLHRQPDYIRKRTFDPLNKFISTFLYPIGTGFALPIAAFDVFGNLLFGTFAGIYDCNNCFDNLYGSFDVQ